MENIADIEFIPYEESIELRDLGFDSICLYIYDNHRDNIRLPIYGLFDNEEPERFINAPLYTQVFNWFREKHNIEGFTTPLISEVKGITFNNRKYQSFVIKDGNRYDSRLYDTFDEAQIICVRKIINIMKEKNNNLK
jgi:hypothetical protein